MSLQGIQKRPLNVDGIDITTEASTEVELWRSMGDEMPQIVWSSPPSGELDYLNRQYYRYIGQPEGTGLGKDWMRFVHPEDLDGITTKWQQTLISATPFDDVELRIRGLEGYYRWFLCRVKAIKHNGEVVRWIGTCTDIDDRHKERENLKAAAIKKDQFLAMLAHELRNPLSVIANGVQLLSASAMDECKPCPVAQDSICFSVRDMILRQTKHLSRLVDDLLDVSRITRGKIVLRRAPIEVRDIVTMGLEHAHHILADKKQVLSVTLPSESIKVLVDSVRMSQVVSNLVNNSAKYTPENGHIVVSAWKEGNRVIISVKDNGIGIEQDAIEYIFELFAQANHSLDRAQGGLGIGLTLVKSIVELHDGTIEAKSEGRGKGSEFLVSLDITESQGPPQPQPQLSHLKLKAVSRTILVVDDMADATFAIGNLLKLQGHKVFTAKDGPSALLMIPSIDPEVILLDIGLPGMDGYEVAKIIRQQYSKKITLIAVTGYGTAEDMEKSFHVGFDAHLVKPVEPKDLTDIIR